MGLNRFPIVVMMLVLLGGQYWWCDGCIEGERIALLKLKDAFKFSYPDISYDRGFLHPWVEDSDCCNWTRVYCKATTGRVTELHLSSTRDWDLGDWYLNASLFLPFGQLESLSLSQNRIAGCVENEGFERLSSLVNLKRLDLGYNRFNNSILSSLGGLSSLTSLDLSSNEFKGVISIDELNNLTSLVMLDIGRNEIEGFKSFHGGDALLRLSSLKSLHLNRNRFDNSILSSLRGLSSLTNLDITYNQLKGSFNMKELDALGNLRALSLNGNQITEFVFSKDRVFGNLSFIDLSNITTNGISIPFSLLQSLRGFPNLRTLYIGENNFEGATSEQAWHFLENLEVLDLYSSTLNNNFLQTIGKITTLNSLYLSDCKLKGTIPTAQGLCELKHLRELDMRENDLSGPLPWCLANLTFLQSLYLNSNHFNGDISLSPLTSLTSIHELSLSHNHFRIPISLRSFYNHSQLKTFYAWENELCAGTDEHNLTPKFQLERLDLSGDGYSGAFPKFLFHQYNLTHIYFSGMNIRGGFPNWLLENNTNLETLYLANNSLSGPFQLPIHPHLNLSELDISNNHFDNHILTKFGASFPSLTFLSMFNNNFSGSIPNSVSTMLNLEVLDLSRNTISGTLSSGFDSPNLLHVYLSQNRLQGSMEDAFNNSLKLITLDLSHNCLTGGIPKWIGKLSALSFLLLDYNHLEGRIPIQLCKLDKLRFVDISHNNFSGRILPCLRFRSSLWYLELPVRPVAYDLREPLEITTKSISYSYDPSTLRYMSGLDLSSNNLAGEIPLEIGNLDHIHLLNLSNNCLAGPIPQTFSNLSEVESLDLSNNNLNGEIPPQLIQLHSLSFFSVAHNNFSGKTPEMVAQFATFNESSYEQNPLLCGPPLPKHCPGGEATGSPQPRTSADDNEDGGFMDTTVFYVSFVVTYIMVLLSIAAVLYINPHWRRAWFHFVEQRINNCVDCYHFLVDNLPMSSSIRV